MSKHFGKCALCKKECELTFEHIPPRKAFNSLPAKPVSWESIVKRGTGVPWDITGLPYQNQQKGMGLYSLCKTCNSNTGSWYGEAYRVFSERIAYLVANFSAPNYHSVEIQKMYPLQICKQVISMFCSVNPNVKIDDLRKFVLNKEAVGIDKEKYKLCMYFTRSNVKRFNGLSAAMDIKENSLSVVSEIISYPLGFLLYFDPNEGQKYRGVDITAFADCKYDDICNIKMPIHFYEVNNWLPLDYRSKAEILGVDQSE